MISLTCGWAWHRQIILCSLCICNHSTRKGSLYLTDSPMTDSPMSILVYQKYLGAPSASHALAAHEQYPILAGEWQKAAASRARHQLRSWNLVMRPSTCLLLSAAVRVEAGQQRRIAVDPLHNKTVLRVTILHVRLNKMISCCLPR